MKRKLTTIFFADGVGFSQHMASDEAGTLMRLKRARAMMGEIFAQRDGRQVNTWGDAVIAEFPSVVEAVRAAVEIQDALASEQASTQDARPITFRIGVNLGDVMIDGSDIYGDGVNVAQRLQELAAPGGVAISETVHSLVHKQLALQFDYLGESSVRNMAEAVTAWRIAPRSRNTPPAPPAPSGSSGKDDPQREAGFQASEGLFERLGTRLDTIRGWVMAQHRGVQRAAGAILFFFAINLLFTGIATPWFIFPAAPFALYIWRHARRTQHGRGRRRRDARGG
ncbi:MAG: adenylate/guanylate cyclase domain-containing protein [Pseudomonadota bacterium]